MPTHPTPPGFKTCTFQFRSDLVEHIDRERNRLGMSRVAYVRGLIVRDMERQGATRIPLGSAQQG